MAKKQQINYNYWPKLADKCVNQLTLQDSQENSNYLTAFNQLCSSTSGRIWSFCSQGVKFQNHQFNVSHWLLDIPPHQSKDKWTHLHCLKSSSRVNKSVVVTFTRLSPSYTACWKMACQKIVVMHITLKMAVIMMYIFSWICYYTGISVAAIFFEGF